MFHLTSSVTLLGILPNRPSLLASVTVVVGRTSLTLSPTEWMFKRLPTGTKLINLNNGQIRIYVTVTIWVCDIYIFSQCRTWRELSWHWSSACWCPCCWSGPPGCCTWCWRPACSWTSPPHPGCWCHQGAWTGTLVMGATVTVFLCGSSDLTAALNLVVMRRRCHPHPETNNYTPIET